MSIAFELHSFFIILGSGNLEGLFFVVVVLVGLIVSSVYPVPLSVLTQFQ